MYIYSIMSLQARKKTLRKTSKTYRLDTTRIEAARKALGAKTATEAIERALDLVVLRRELVEGTKRMLGVRIERSDD